MGKSFASKRGIYVADTSVTGCVSRRYSRRGKNAKFVASQRVLPGLIAQFSVQCIITMRVPTLLYVPYRVSGFWGGEGEEKRIYLQSSSFLFLTDFGVMTGLFLISRKLTAPG